MREYEMKRQEMQDIADDLGLGKIHFQFNVAKNTGKEFEVGYVIDADSDRKELFCKRNSGDSSEFRLCNEYAERGKHLLVPFKG